MHYKITSSPVSVTDLLTIFTNFLLATNEFLDAVPLILSSLLSASIVAMVCDGDSALFSRVFHKIDKEL